jgi:predicted nucleotidyltransferase
MSDANIQTMRLTPNLESLIATLRADARIAAAILFGSAAAGRLRADSDVDVAVMYADAKARDSFERDLLMMLGRLGAAAGRDVHLIDLERVDCALRRKIFASGSTLFDRTNGRRRDLAVQTLLEYFDWEYARRVIDESHRRRLGSAIG